MLVLILGSFFPFWYHNWLNEVLFCKANLDITYSGETFQPNSGIKTINNQ